MRVCHVTSAHPPLDVRIFHRECRSLARAGYDVTIVAPADFRQLLQDGVRISGLPTVSSRRQRFMAWVHIVRRLRRLRPDIVHFHDPELLLCAQLFRPARLIYDCHEYVAESILTRPWIPPALRRPLAWLIGVLEPLLARQADAVVIASPGQAGRFQGVELPLTLLHNFPFLAPTPLPRRSDGSTLIHVGAHAEVRGTRDMIEAMVRVRSRVPGARLLLVGPFNHRPYEAEMRRLIKERGLDEAVQLVGPLPYPKVARWLAQADVGLIPSRRTAQYEHALPSKLFDYMMAALPVVSVDLSETRRFVSQAQCGLLVEPGDREALAEAIVTLLLDADMRTTMGAAGRRAYETRFNWGCEERKLLDLYQQVSAA